MQKKKGISLIVLVITIIVMIVLAGAIILSLNNAGIIGKSNEAVSESDYKTVYSAAQLVYADIILGKSTGELWTGQYIKEQLIADGIITAEQATRYRFRNNGEVIKLQTEAEYNAMYKTELEALNESYYTITDGVFKLTTEGINAIKESKLTTVAIPYGVTTIGRYAFNGCANLKKLIMPDTIITVGDVALVGCTNLEDIVFSKNFKNSQYSAIENTKWLQNKKSGLKNGDFIIEQGVMLYAEGANGNIIIPDSVEVIGESVFAYNKNITRVVIPDTVEIIEDSAFYCSSLAKVEFEGNIPELGECSFGLTKIPGDETYAKMYEKNMGAFDE